MYWRYKLFLSILALFLVVGACSGDDLIPQQPTPQASAAGMGASVITAVTTVAGPIVDLLNTVVTTPPPGQQSPQLILGVEGPPITIPCELNTFMIVTPTFDDETGALTSVHVVASGCILNEGTVTLNFTADITNIGFPLSPILCDPDGEGPADSLPVPTAFNALINGSFTLAQDSVSVPFTMTNLGMSFSNITYLPDCSITGLRDIVTGVISTTIPVINEQAIFDFGNGSVTFDVDVQDESDLLFMDVDGDITVTTPCFNGSFHMSTATEDGGETLSILEGKTCPTGGKIVLTGGLNETVDFDDPATCSSPACLLPSGGGDGGGGGKVVHAAVSLEAGGTVQLTASAEYECTDPIQDNPCSLQIFDIPGGNRYFQYLSPESTGQCFLFDAVILGPDDEAYHLSGIPNRTFGVVNAGSPIPFATGTVGILNDPSDNSAGETPVGTFEFFEYCDQSEGCPGTPSDGFKGFTIPGTACSSS
jgi:hypothetical protein